MGILAYYAARRHDIDLAVRTLATSPLSRARVPVESAEIAIALFSAIGGRIGDALFTPEEVDDSIDEVRDDLDGSGLQLGTGGVGSRAADEALVARRYRTRP